MKRNRQGQKPPEVIEATAGDDTFQFTAAGTVQIRAGLDKDGKEDKDKVPSFSLLGYTGGVMSVWRGATVIDLAGLAMPASVPVLHDHDASDPVGHGTPTIEGSNLTLAGTFSVAESPSAQKIISSSKREFPWQASVGVAVTRFEKAAAGQEVSVNGQSFIAGADGLYVIRAGSLREISIVPLGADANTNVKVVARAVQTQQEKNMNEFEKWLQAKGFDPATPTETQKTFLKASYDAEQALVASGTTGATGFAKLDEEIAEGRRQSAIEEMAAAAVGVMPAAERVIAGVAIRSLAASAIAEKWTIQKFDTELLRAKRPAAVIHITSHDRAVTQEVLEAAILTSTGTPDTAVVKAYGEQVAERAHKAYKGNLGLQELMIQAAKANGYAGRDRVTEGNWREMLSWAAPGKHGGHGGQIQAAGFSTIDLTGILGNVANKAIGAMAADPVWLAPTIAGVANHSNFHSHTVYSLALNGELLPVAPDGEIKHLDLAEESYTRQVGTRGALLRISRTDMINDDLGVFTRNATAMARKAYTTREKALFTAICATANGISHFTAARGNYIAGGTTVLSPAGLDQAVAAFRGLQGPDGDPIMVEPAILLVPSTLEGTARRLLAAGSSNIAVGLMVDATPPTIASNANIYGGRFGGAPSVSPWLENAALVGASAAYYYLLAAPSQYPCFEIAYLNGAQAPTVEYFGLETQADTLGMTWRIYWDFGVGAAEWRAGVKVAGA